MERSARFFSCARCKRQVTICNDCDHGNIYCSTTCSSSARKQSQRQAGQRYQASHKGKLKHAARQKLYKLRQKNKKVTHLGSPDLPPNDLLPTEPNEPMTTQEVAQVEYNTCWFCKKTCSPFLRLGYLRHSVADISPRRSSSWPLGP